MSTNGDGLWTCKHGVEDGLCCWKCRDEEHDRNIEAETARKIAEMMRASVARIRANGGDDDTSIAIALEVEIDAIERGEWKKP